jgi:hypothetical protein
VPASPGGPAPPVGKHRRRIDFSQIPPLVQRTFKVRLRDLAQVAILAVQAPLIALVLLLVYHNIGQRSGVLQALEWKTLVGKLAGTHCMMAVAAVWFGCNVACREIVGEAAIYKRERMVSLKIPSYIGSKFVTLGTICAMQCLLLACVVYGFSTLQAPFWDIYAVLLSTSLVGVAIGLFVSALSRTTEAAVAYLPILLLPMILLSGGMKPLHEMDQPAPAIATVMPTRWAFEANLLQEARHRAVQGPSAAGPSAADLAEIHFPAARKRAESRTVYAYLFGMLGFWIILLAGALKWRDSH